jgi:thioredoxin 1
MSISLKDAKEIQALGDGIICLNFWADWAQPCPQMNALCDQLAEKYPNVKFVKVIL